MPFTSTTMIENVCAPQKNLKGKLIDNALECARMATVINAVQCIPSLEEIPTNVIETDFGKKETAPVQTRVETERKYHGRIGMKEIKEKIVLVFFFLCPVANFT